MEEHARTCGASEACGLVYKNAYFPIQNSATAVNRHYADPGQLAHILARYGEPAAVFHTHPRRNLSLSHSDIELFYYSYSTMIIGSLQDGRLILRAYRS